MKKIAFVCMLVVLSWFPAQCRAQDAAAQARQPARGVWVSVFNKKHVLYSKDAVRDLVSVCTEAGINEIYLQVFQSGRAYYDTRLLDRLKYEGMLKKAGGDMIDLLLQEAGRNNIRVFAWLNLLSLGQNNDAQIIEKFGEDVLTRDQFMRPSGQADANASDDYYLREDQLFLEPGDPRVAAFLAPVAAEVVTRYPSLSGIHLDYVRYPMTVPFIPGSKFMDYGVSYGYGGKNAGRFKASSGKDPLKGLGNEQDFLRWDDWRREQVTAVVEAVARAARQKSPGIEISAAVVPSGERAYSSMFQDWPGWLQDGLIDYAVLMSYSQDNRLITELVRAAKGLRGRGRVYAAIGAFLMKGDADSVARQYRLVRELQPDGIIFFAYDDITPELIALLQKDILEP